MGQIKALGVGSSPDPFEVVVQLPDVSVQATFFALCRGDLGVIQELLEEARLQVICDVNPGELEEDPRGIYILLDGMHPHPGELVLPC